MNPRPFKSDKPCARCGNEERRPYSDFGAICLEIVRKEKQKEYDKGRREREAKGPIPIPCKCGCPLTTVYPKLYATDECRARARQLSVQKQTERKKAEGGIKPHRPIKAVKTLSEKEIARREEEQARLDAEASARDRAWHAKFIKEQLGLESPAPGLPLASKVVRPPAEVFREYEAAYKPQRECQPREYWIPSRGDVSY